MTAAKKAAAKKAPAKKAAAKPGAKVELDTTAPEVAPPVESASQDVKKLVEKQAAGDALGSAGERRADYLAALEQELDMCERSGKGDRVSAIKAEISRVKKSVSGRSEKPSDEA